MDADSKWQWTGLLLFGGAQLVVDMTLVSALHCSGIARRGAAHNEGVAVSMAERRKERRYPELVGHRARSLWWFWPLK